MGDLVIGAAPAASNAGERQLIAAVGQERGGGLIFLFGARQSPDISSNSPATRCA
jgi:hypothetical protein